MKTNYSHSRCVVLFIATTAIAACSSPPPAPTLTLGYGLKTLEFNWTAVADAERYRLLADLEGVTSFSQIGTDLSAETTRTSVPVAVHLYPWDTARYVLEACNTSGCSRSDEVSPLDGMTDAIGYVKASNAGVDDQFGGGSVIYGLSASISADGNTMAVSSIFEDSASTEIDGNESDNSAIDAGAVYVFVHDNAGWAQEAYVKASNTESSDQFGYSVSLSGDGNTLAVGANLEASSATGIDGDQSDNSALGAGAVYVYRRDNGVWNQQAYLKASNAEAGDVFGYQVALSFDGNTLVATAQGEDSASSGIGFDEANNDAGGSGAAYVFTRDGDAWSQQAYVKAMYPEENDLFGTSVAISHDGDTIAIGALDEDGPPGINGDQSDNSERGSGAAYVFTRSGNSWQQEAYVKGQNTQRADAYGAVVALSADGNTLAVGAPDENNTSTGANAEVGHRVGFDPRTDYSNGSAYVFYRENGEWREQGYIKPSHLGQFDQFGTRIALNGNGDVLAVGVPLEDSPSSGLNGFRGDDEAGGSEFGAIWLYTRDTEGVWSEKAYVKAPNAGVYDEFASVVALDEAGTTMIVGARFEDSAATGIGGDLGNDDARDSGAVFIY
ncbi:MAG: FG-GAP repeat protein [Gammaproteobacteria bacterium]